MPRPPTRATMTRWLLHVTRHEKGMRERRQVLPRAKKPDTTRSTPIRQAASLRRYDEYYAILVISINRYALIARDSLARTAYRFDAITGSRHSTANAADIRYDAARRLRVSAGQLIHTSFSARRPGRPRHAQTSRSAPLTAERPRALYGLEPPTACAMICAYTPGRHARTDDFSPYFTSKVLSEEAHSRLCRRRISYYFPQRARGRLNAAISPRNWPAMPRRLPLGYRAQRILPMLTRFHRTISIERRMRRVLLQLKSISFFHDGGAAGCCRWDFSRRPTHA